MPLIRHSDLMKLRGRLMLIFPENIRKIILNSTEQINFCRNLYRKNKNFKAGDRVLLQNHQKQS